MLGVEGDDGDADAEPALAELSVMILPGAADALADWRHGLILFLCEAKVSVFTDDGASAYVKKP